MNTDINRPDDPANQPGAGEVTEHVSHGPSLYRCHKPNRATATRQPHQMSSMLVSTSPRFSWRGGSTVGGGVILSWA
jgi:hypothetical protein